MNTPNLIKQALQARNFAYAPYSHFAVGAALVTEDNKVYTGCNIESSAFTPSNCAERTAFFKAISEGNKKFKSIVVVGDFEGKPVKQLCPPCGMCRQVMMEFCEPETFEIIVANSNGETQMFKLKDLLPFGFGPSNLNI